MRKSLERTHFSWWRAILNSPEDGIEGDAAGEDLEHHEVEVGGHTSEKLDEGCLVILGVQGEREDDPDGREGHHGEGQEVGLPPGPVLDRALPEVPCERLDSRIGDHLLQLALDEDI